MAVLLLSSKEYKRPSLLAYSDRRAVVVEVVVEVDTVVVVVRDTQPAA